MYTHGFPSSSRSARYCHTCFSFSVVHDCLIAARMTSEIPSNITPSAPCLPTSRVCVRCCTCSANRARFRAPPHPCHHPQLQRRPRARPPYPPEHLQTLVRHIKVKRGRSGVALVGQTPRAPVAHRTSSNKCRHVFLVDTCRHLFGRRVSPSTKQVSARDTFLVSAHFFGVAGTRSRDGFTPLFSWGQTGSNRVKLGQKNFGA